MRYLIAGLLALFLCGAAPIVEPGLVGTWTDAVPNNQGTARWVWDIHADGTYSFHAEGPGNVPAHSGNMTASGGQYHLSSNTMTWTDNGTYQLQGNYLSAKGVLGPGTWQRMSANDAAPPTDAVSLQAGLAQIPSGANVPNDTDSFGRAVCNLLLTVPMVGDLLPPGREPGTPKQIKSTDPDFACVIRLPIMGPQGEQSEVKFLVYKSFVGPVLYHQFGVWDSTDFKVKGESDPDADSRCQSLAASDGNYIGCDAVGAQPYGDLVKDASPLLITVMAGAPKTVDASAYRLPAQIIRAANDYFRNRIVDLAYADSKFLAAKEEASAKSAAPAAAQAAP